MVTLATARVLSLRVAFVEESTVESESQYELMQLGMASKTGDVIKSFAQLAHKLREQRMLSKEDHRAISSWAAHPRFSGLPGMINPEEVDSGEDFDHVQELLTKVEWMRRRVRPMPDGDDGEDEFQIEEIDTRSTTRAASWMTWTRTTASRRTRPPAHAPQRHGEAGGDTTVERGSSTVAISCRPSMAGRRQQRIGIDGVDLEAAEALIGASSSSSTYEEGGEPPSGAPEQRCGGRGRGGRGNRCRGATR